MEWTFWLISKCYVNLLDSSCLCFYCFMITNLSLHIIIFKYINLYNHSFNILSCVKPLNCSYWCVWSDLIIYFSITHTKLAQPTKLNSQLARAKTPNIHTGSVLEPIHHTPFRPKCSRIRRVAQGTISSMWRTSLTTVSWLLRKRHIHTNSGIMTVSQSLWGQIKKK